MKISLSNLFNYFSVSGDSKQIKKVPFFVDAAPKDVLALALTLFPLMFFQRMRSIYVFRIAIV